MLGSLLILLVLPILDTSNLRSNQFRPLSKLSFWFLVVDFIILTWIGSQHPESPYVEIGQIASLFYFASFLLIVPAVGVIENTLFDISLDSDSKIKPQTLVYLLLKGKSMPLNRGCAFHHSTLNSRPNPQVVDKDISLDSSNAGAPWAGLQVLLSEKKELFQIPAAFDFNAYRHLANGFFQAEGHIGCRIRPGVGRSFFPVFTLVQNFSEESLNNFLRLLFV